ncbi:class I SAM-dependent methyltransferase [Lapillicoccus sp.]|uniref:class I SAM-dependent methyltransferase n=1 Tax=Lapillicoccus sp. TaxID=1909287 RepID=UPI003263E4EC
MSEMTAVRKYYDRIGRGQDTQRFYEDPPTDRLRQCAEFETAASLVELCCGTGRFARTLLREQLPAVASYRGFELSGRAAAIAASRLRPWAGRAAVTRIDGDPPLPLDEAAADRFIANYVLDLMPPAQACQWLDEAHRILAPAGLLCLVSITPGVGHASRLVSDTWTRLWRHRPSLVGGCRPIELLDLLAPDQWATRHHEVVTAWSVSSEVVVAQRR